MKAGFIWFLGLFSKKKSEHLKKASVNEKFYAGSTGVCLKEKRERSQLHTQIHTKNGKKNGQKKAHLSHQKRELKLRRNENEFSRCPKRLACDALTDEG